MGTGTYKQESGLVRGMEGEPGFYSAALHAETVSGPIADS